MTKKVCVFVTSPPYKTSNYTEAIRLVSALIAMDVIPVIVFLCDGVYCLLENQNPSEIGQETFKMAFDTIKEFGFKIHVLKESLVGLGLKRKNLMKTYPLKIISENDLAEIISQVDIACRF